MDERIIQYIKEHRDIKNKDCVQYIGQKDKYGERAYLTVSSVDISKLWTIRDWDTADKIEYIDVDKDINYCKVDYQIMD
jgi:hypothetical protein